MKEEWGDREQQLTKGDGLGGGWAKAGKLRVI